jgi:hypothetical protein
MLGNGRTIKKYVNILYIIFSIVAGFSNTSLTLMYKLRRWQNAKTWRPAFPGSEAAACLPVARLDDLDLVAFFFIVGLGCHLGDDVVMDRSK